MYRILIVDDELHVVDWLYELLSDMDDVELDLYKATTVTEAVNWLGRSRMDIVITDIAMPGMTGLELHTHIRKAWPACRVIFLTGYSDFEYAYEAVRNEAAGYVLKTEDDDVIVAAVHRAIAGLEEALSQQLRLQQAEDRMRLAMAALHSDFLFALLRGEQINSEQRIRSFTDLDIKLDANQPVVIVIAKVDRGSRESMLLKPQLFPSVAQLVEQAVLARWKYCISLTTLESIIWLVQEKKAQEGSVIEAEKYILESLERVQSDYRQRWGLSFSIILADQPIGWEEIAQKQMMLQQWLVQRMNFGSGMLLTESDRDRAQGAVFVSESQLDRSKLDLFRIQLEKGQREAVDITLVELQQSIMDNSLKLHSNAGLELFFGVSVPLIAFLNRWQLHLLIKAENVMDKLTKPELFSDWQEFFYYYQCLGQEAFHLLSKRHNDQESNVIRHIKEYIQANLHTGISLVELADQVFYNPSYLSRQFKETTGQSVTEYMSELRLERAIIMLKEHKKISEIAEAVGIESPAYFSRFFKKMTQRTPQEYREALLLGYIDNPSR